MGFVRYVRKDECGPESTLPECALLPMNLILDAGAISDSDIKNEELKSYEIGYNGYFMDRKLSLDMRLYFEQIRDLIDERRDGYPDLDNFVNIRDNVGTMDIRGIEFQTVYKPNDRLLLRAITAIPMLTVSNVTPLRPVLVSPVGNTGFLITEV